MAGINQVLQHVAQTMEKQLDSEIERLDALDNSDLEAIRQQRLKELKDRAKLKQEWLANGHGEYTEIDGEKEFFTVCNKSSNVVCHFYKNDSPRCKIVDMHLKILAKKHVECRFVKLDVERAPFLTGRLKIRVIPTIGLVKDNKTTDFIVGFTELGNKDDFTTEVLEWRIARLDALDNSDLEAIRQQRLKELKDRAKLKQEWLANGHGEYTEIDGEKEFFTVCNKSSNVVCHFYKNDSPRCKIVDMHLKILAKKHVECRFVKLDVERAPFLTGRLKIRVIPTIGLVKDNKTTDFIVGFTELGNKDDFTTEVLEWRIARSEVIEYSGDLLTPPEQARKQKALQIQNKSTIRGGNDTDSDLELSD